MTDIIERLDKAYFDIGQHYGYVACIEEAAEEIKQLRGALKALIEETDRSGDHEAEAYALAVATLAGGL